MPELVNVGFSRPQGMAAEHLRKNAACSREWEWGPLSAAPPQPCTGQNGRRTRGKDVHSRAILGVAHQQFRGTVPAPAPPPPIVHPTAGEDRQKKKTRNTGGALLRGNIFRVGGPLASCGQNGKDYAGVCKRGPQQNIAGVLMVRAKPKSQSFTIFSREMSTFSGFTSRWMTCPPTAAAMGKDRRPPDIRRGPGCAQSGGQATHAVGMTKLQAAQDLEGDLFELDIIESCSPAEMGGKRGCAATWQ